MLQTQFAREAEKSICFWLTRCSNSHFTRARSLISSIKFSFKNPTIFERTSLRMSFFLDCASEPWWSEKSEQLNRFDLSRYATSYCSVTNELILSLKKVLKIFECEPRFDWKISHFLSSIILLKVWKLQKVILIMFCLDVRTLLLR